MKKSLVAVALLGGFAAVAQAQTAVQIYGNLDAGLVKRTDQSIQIGKRAANNSERPFIPSLQADNRNSGHYLPLMSRNGM